MKGAAVAALPKNFKSSQLNLENDCDTDTTDKPLLRAKTPWSKRALGFIFFVALGVIMLATEMQVLPHWASFDPKCSPATVDVSTVNFRSSDRFYTVLKKMKALSPPTFRQKHTELCNGEHDKTREFQYCLPISSQEDSVFCAGADRMELFARQSPLTLCRSSVMHMLLSDVYEELEAAGMSPSIKSSSGDIIATVGSFPDSTSRKDVSTIMYSGVITRDDRLNVALWKKGYHLFQSGSAWRLCVAPTHPLALHLYDPDRALENEASSVPLINLVIASSEPVSGKGSLKTIKAELGQDKSCSPNVLNAKDIDYLSNHRFYSMLQTMKTLPPPTFQTDHTVLCDKDDVEDEKIPYCLPISARSDVEFCAGADRIDLLVRQSPSTICLESILHLLAADIFDELQAGGGSPVLQLYEEKQLASTYNTNITYSAVHVDLNELKMSLLRKGYNLFGEDTWRVCVAPTHPLAALLYDPHQPVLKEYRGPYILLVPKIEASAAMSENVETTSSLGPQEAKNNAISGSRSAEENKLQETKASDLSLTGCTPNLVEAIDDGTGGEFNSMMEDAGSLPPPRFRGDHEVLCSSDDRKQRGYSYCLPISGEKDTSRCANADRMDILLHQSPKKQCFSSVLHLLLKDVYEELKKVGFTPILTFGSLLGAVRDGGLIPFTEDVDIAYNGNIVDGEDLDQRLWRKGYHLFQYNIFRVCVAPTHPLASQLYDAEHPIVEDYLVPYVDLYSMEQEFGSAWSMQELKIRSLPNERVQPFSQVAINGEKFDTVHDPDFLLASEYGTDYMIPKPRHRRLFGKENVDSTNLVL